MSVSAGKRIRRSADDWREIFERQRSSGLKQAAFCQREGIALSTFARWKQRLSDKADPDHQAGDRAGGDWIDLSRLAGGRPGWTIELDLGDGICLRLARG